MCRLGGSRGAIGGAVLVASKVLRALALLAGYRVLADGLSSVLFAAATLGFTSVVLLVLQRPWTGKELSTKHMVKVAVQSLLLGSSFVLWAGGLLLCGPATTVMLEYTEVMLLRMGRSLLGTQEVHNKRATRLGSIGRSLAVLASVCVLLAWEGAGRDHDDSRPRGLSAGAEARGNATQALAADTALPLGLLRAPGKAGRKHAVRQPWVGGAAGAGEGGDVHATALGINDMQGWDGDARDPAREVGAEEGGGEDMGDGDDDESLRAKRARRRRQQERDIDAAIPLEFAARTPVEFLTGIGLHVLASTLSALRKGQAHAAGREVGGPKRLFALACPTAVLWLYLLIVYAWLSDRASAAFVVEAGGGGVAVGVGRIDASKHPIAAVAGAWRQLLQFAGMGLLVPFYAGNFADKNLPASDSARIGLLSSVACFVFTWAVLSSLLPLKSSGVRVQHDDQTSIARTRARTHARTHALTLARARARAHTHTHTHTHRFACRRWNCRRGLWPSLSCFSCYRWGTRSATTRYPSGYTVCRGWT